MILSSKIVAVKKNAARWGLIKQTGKDSDMRKKLAGTRLTMNQAREKEVFVLNKEHAAKPRPYFSPTLAPLDSKEDKETALEEDFFLDEHDVLNFDYDDYFFVNIILHSIPVDGGLSRDTVLQPVYPLFEDNPDSQGVSGLPLLDIPVDMTTLPKEKKEFDVKRDHFISDENTVKAGLFLRRSNGVLQDKTNILSDAEPGLGSHKSGGLAEQSSGEVKLSAFVELAGSL
jgi:hypothetical protein